MGFFQRLFGSKVTLDDAKSLQDALGVSAIGPSVSARTNAAARLMTSKQFDACIAAYEAIAVDFPDHRGECEGQIGAGRYFKGDYEGAVAMYVSARSNGADDSNMDDNIWESIEAIAKPLAEPDKKTTYQRYAQLCPNGRYMKKLAKLYP